jgi:hypothetical protein
MRRLAQWALGVSLFLLSVCAMAQEQGIMEAFGGSSDDVFYDVTATPDGGAVAVGCRGYSGGAKMLVVRVDSCGDVVWEKLFGETNTTSVARFVIRTYDGGYAVGGYTNSLASVESALCIMKLNSAGTRLWGKAVLDPDGGLDFWGYDGIEDSDHDLAITGRMQRNVPDKSSLLLSGFDTNGNHLVTKNFYGTLSAHDYGYSVIERNDGHYVVLGQMENLQGQKFVLLFGVNHLFLVPWGWYIGDASEVSAGLALAETADNGAVLTGSAGGKLFVSRRDADLNPLWQKKWNSTSEGRSVIQINGGDFRVAGSGGGLWRFNLAGTSCSFVNWDAPGCTLYAVGEDGGPNYPLWVAGLTTGWGAGGRDALLVKWRNQGYTCVGGYVLTACSSWAPPEGAHDMNANTPTVQVWNWLPPVSDMTAVAVYCDDECVEECCLPNGTCLELTPKDCENHSPAGVAQGSDTTCTPLGACCLPDYTCITTSQECCEDAQGVWLGAGTTCGPTGACCLPGEACFVTTQQCCQVAGGYYEGDGRLCEPTPCWGACCLPTGQCVEGLYEDQCVARGGTFHSGVPCGVVMDESYYARWLVGRWLQPGVTEDAQQVWASTPVGKLRIDVLIVHSNLGMLRIELEHDGVVATLWNGACSGARHMNVVFDDDAPAVTCGSPTLGDVNPLSCGPGTSSLSTFRGMEAGGLWILRVFSNGHYGRLARWSYQVQFLDQDPCVTERAGACCFSDGSCQHLTESQCQGQGGTFHYTVPCGFVECPNTSRCCFWDGSCQDLTQARCLAAGGTWYPGDHCNSGSTCPLPPSMACCLPSACMNLWPIECGAAGACGWQGHTICGTPGFHCHTCTGDMNCDGQVDFGDINPFVLYLSDVSAWQSRYPNCPPQNGDINLNCVYPSFDDINPFVRLLSSGSLPIVCP